MKKQAQTEKKACRNIVLHITEIFKDRKSVVQGKSVDLGGRRSIKKKKKRNKKTKKKKKKKKDKNRIRRSTETHYRMTALELEKSNKKLE